MRRTANPLVTPLSARTSKADWNLGNICMNANNGTKMSALADQTHGSETQLRHTY